MELKWDKEDYKNTGLDFSLLDFSSENSEEIKIAVTLVQLVPGIPFAQRGFYFLN